MQKDDFRWFVENHKRLYQEYGDCCLAIKDKTILGIYKSFAEGVIATRLVHTPGTFIVQELSESTDCYTAYLASNFEVL